MRYFKPAGCISNGTARYFFAVKKDALLKLNRIIINNLWCSLNFWHGYRLVLPVSPHRNLLQGLQVRDGLYSSQQQSRNNVMNAKKNLLAIAVALSLGLSGAAWADQQGGDGDPNTNAAGGSTSNNDNSGNASSGNDNSTNNSDNRTDDTDNNSNNSINDANNNQANNSTNDSNNDASLNVADSGNADNSDSSTNDDSDSSTNDDSDNSINDSYNDESDNSIAGSYNDSSDSSTNMLTMSTDMFLNSAELNGSVSDVSVNYGDANARGASTGVRTSNSIGDGSANFTGVGAFAQNVGVGSITQANVSVMSNLTASGGTN
jgi:hypothetical protein